jgi:hypothetical protein
MLTITKKMPTFEGVGAGQTATVRLPVGMRYHKLLIPYSGVTLAQINEIRVIANGKVFQRLIGGAVLDSINQYDGRNAAAGILTVDFERYGLITRAGRELTVIDTTVNDKKPEQRITTLSVEVDIDGEAVSPVLGAPTAAQSAYAVGSNPLLKHVRVFGYDPAGSGEFQISDLPKFGAINRIFFKSSAVINEIKLERETYVVFERSKAVNESIQANGVRVPQAGYYVLDFTEEGNGQDWLEVQGVQDLRLKLDMAGAGHIDVIVEYINPLNG